MIITRDRLVELAREEAETRASRRPLLAAYLVGSVANGDPLFAGAADIDLILIHPAPPLRPHEIVGLSADVHLDIFHRSRQEYDPPRELRTDPDLGPGLYNAIRLHDPDHFFDWVHAAACAQFDSPQNRLARAEAFLQRARRGCAGLSQADSWPQVFAHSALDGANAVATLSGPPAAGRRVVDSLRQTLSQLDRLDLFASFLQLFGANQLDGWDLPSWLTTWAKSYDLALTGSDNSSLAPVRRDYYLRAFQAMADREQAASIVLPLLLLWPTVLPSADHPRAEEIFSAWNSLLQAAGLDPEHQPHRLTDLEGFLDRIERGLLEWGEAHGA